MHCPVCQQPLIVLELDQVEIDYCLSCKGIWLDAGELELLLEGTQWQEDLLKSFAPDHTTKERRVRCPICHKKMIKVNCGNSQPPNSELEQNPVLKRATSEDSHPVGEVLPVEPQFCFKIGVEKAFHIRGWDQKILIDQCQDNDGLWCDEGELEKMIQRGSFGKDHRVLGYLKDILGKR